MYFGLGAATLTLVAPFTIFSYVVMEVSELARGCTAGGLVMSCGAIGAWRRNFRQSS